jgi:PilZ domain-containing protein
MQEQRAAPRFRVDLNVRWETLKSQGRGAVSDLSTTGCFVLTGGEVSASELARLQITSSHQVAVMWGQVIYAISEMGFAVRFVFGGEDERRVFDGFIKSLQSTS